MQKRLILLVSLALAVVFGCSSHSTDTSTTKPAIIGAPSGLILFGSDTTGVTVYWKRGANDNQQDTVFVFNGVTEVEKIITRPIDTEAAIINMLHSGITYSISVHGPGGVSETVTWKYVAPQPPSNVQVVSLSSNAIGVKWTGDGFMDTVYAADSAGVIQASAPSNTGTATLIGLSENVKYSIVVRSLNGSSNTIVWMTARRYSAIKIYQFNSLNTSGLDLKNGNAVSTNTANAASLDLVLDDIEDNSAITAPSGLALEGPQIMDASWRSSYVSTLGRLYLAGGLDADFRSTNLAADAADIVVNQANALEIPDDGSDYRKKGDRIIVVSTADGNLAKIDIIPDATTGKLYSGTSPNKYITVNVSYQPKSGAPYAARAHSHSGLKEAFKPVF